MIFIKHAHRGQVASFEDDNELSYSVQAVQVRNKKFMVLRSLNHSEFHLQIGSAPTGTSMGIFLLWLPFHGQTQHPIGDIGHTVGHCHLIIGLVITRPLGNTIKSTVEIFLGRSNCLTTECVPSLMEEPTAKPSVRSHGRMKTRKTRKAVALTPYWWSTKIPQQKKGWQSLWRANWTVRGALVSRAQ